MDHSRENIEKTRDREHAGVDMVDNSGDGDCNSEYDMDLQMEQEEDLDTALAAFEAGNSEAFAKRQQSDLRAQILASVGDKDVLIGLLNKLVDFQGTYIYSLEGRFNSLQNMFFDSLFTGLKDKLDDTRIRELFDFFRGTSFHKFFVEDGYTEEARVETHMASHEVNQVKVEMRTNTLRTAEADTRTKLTRMKTEYDNVSIRLENKKIELQNVQNQFQAGSSQTNHFYIQNPGHTRAKDSHFEQHKHSKKHCKQRQQPRMPECRDGCRAKEKCKKMKTCRFVHPHQSDFFSKPELDRLPPYITFENCGLPEHGGL